MIWRRLPSLHRRYLSPPIDHLNPQTSFIPALRVAPLRGCTSMATSAAPHAAGKAAAPLAPRVLSVQSHVVSGYVGNKCVVLPLALLGYDVDPVMSVQVTAQHGCCNGTPSLHTLYAAATSCSAPWQQPARGPARPLPLFLMASSRECLGARVTTPPPQKCRSSPITPGTRPSRARPSTGTTSESCCRWLPHPCSFAGCAALHHPRGPACVAVRWLPAAG